MALILCDCDALPDVHKHPAPEIVKSAPGAANPQLSIDLGKWRNAQPCSREEKWLWRHWFTRMRWRRISAKRLQKLSPRAL